MPSITIDKGAKDLLDAIAAREGVTRKQLLHALVNYAASIYIRPGSWEACTAFNLGNYEKCNSAGTRDSTEFGEFADKWHNGDWSASERV
jgi:predicted HAD superfamily hydrolase